MCVARAQVFRHPTDGGFVPEGYVKDRPWGRWGQFVCSAEEIQWEEDRGMQSPVMSLEEVCRPAFLSGKCYFRAGVSNFFLLRTIRPFPIIDFSYPEAWWTRFQLSASQHRHRSVVGMKPHMLPITKDILESLLIPSAFLSEWKICKNMQKKDTSWLRHKFRMYRSPATLYTVWLSLLSNV